jgi:hypothetical protein
MSKRNLLLTAALLIATCGITSAQAVCPLNGKGSLKLICMLPQALGASGFDYGLVFPNGLRFSPFPNVTPITQAVGSRLSQLPIASPSSGITFTYDPAVKTFVVSPEEDLGPIFGERASTIGLHKLFVGFSYQYINFDTIDGHKLDSIPLPFPSFPVPVLFPPSFMVPPCNTTGFPADHSYDGSPCFVRDFVETKYNIDMRVHQYIVYVTYGVTEHLEVSVALPVSNIAMRVVSQATFVPNSSAPQPPYRLNRFNFFNPSIANAPPPPHITVGNCPAAPCFDAFFSDSRSVTGIGDIVLREKYQVYEGEKAGFSIGLEARFPTGDEENFLGSGAIGLKPFAVFSYKGRVSPHALAGYELNGSSLLYGNYVRTPSNTKSPQPSRFVYIAGADVAPTKRITVAFDIYGQRLYGTSELLSSQFTDFGACNDSNCAVVTPGMPHPALLLKGKTDLNIIDASLGAKVRLVKHLVATGNVLFKLNDSSLRAKVVPLVGISYSF